MGLIYLICPKLNVHIYFLNIFLSLDFKKGNLNDMFSFALHPYVINL